MARLYLVRHAQASFGADDYDLLSELGLKQSTFIPAHFSDDPSITRALYHGTMLRQKQTADAAFPAMTAIVDAGLNEFDHMNVLSVHQPAIHDRVRMTEIIMEQKDPRQFMEDEFRTAMGKWMDEEGTSSYHEPFLHFKARVRESIQHLMTTARQEKHKEVIAVTSGGVIALYMTMVLGMPDVRMTELNQQIANTSVTSVLFNDRRTTLSYFNNYSHLPKDMVTFM